MSYYRNTLYFFITVYILAIMFALFYWINLPQLGCWNIPSNSDECRDIMAKENIFNGLVPSLFIVLSALIIVLQEIRYRRVGYLMLLLLAFSPIFYGYIINRSTWFNIKWFLEFIDASTLPVFFDSIPSLFGMLILILISFIPFYVLIRLIREDFFKRK